LKKCYTWHDFDGLVIEIREIFSEELWLKDRLPKRSQAMIAKKIDFKTLIVWMVSAMLVFSTFSVVFVSPGFAQSKCKFRHTVEPGDTLTSIADLYQTDWQEIAEANDLQEPYVLQIDEKLCIPNGVKPGTDTDTDTDSTTTPISDEEGSSAGITALLGFYSMLLEVKNLEDNTVYNVRVGDHPDEYLFTVGRLKTDDNGNYKGYFNLPSLIGTKKAQVCVKNVWTDEIGCALFENPAFYYNIPGCFN
jgi:hypothetical protein